MKIAAAVRAKQIPLLHCLGDDNAAKKRVSVFSHAPLWVGTIQ
jgi:hypothetical protein